MKRLTMVFSLAAAAGAILVAGCGGGGSSVGEILSDAVKSVAKTNVSKTLGLGGLNRQMAGIVPGFGMGGGFGGWFGDIQNIGSVFGMGGALSSREIIEESGYLEWMNLWFKSTYDDVTGSYRYELFEDEAMTKSAGFREYKQISEPGAWPQVWESSYRWQDMDYYAEPVELPVEVGDDGSINAKPGAMPPQAERIWREGTSTSIIDDETYMSGKTFGTYSASNGERSSFEYTYSQDSWSGKDEFIDAEGNRYANESSGTKEGGTTSRWSNPDSRGEMTYRPDGSGQGTLWDGQGNLVANVEWSNEGVLTIRYADGTVEVIDYRYSEGDAKPSEDPGGDDSGGTSGGGTGATDGP